MGQLYLDSGGASTNSGTSDNNSPDLSGSANATIVANTTFVDANVTAATDTINITTHGYTSGTGLELTTTGVLPAGLTLTTLYYLFAVDANNITLHTNLADAIAGTNKVDITAAAGGGTHTVNNMTVALGGSPNLSALVGSHCYVTTTGTSHVFTMGGGIHGLNTGEKVWLEVTTGGTMPTGILEGTTAFVNALSTATFRVYSTAALANAGGASDINISAVAVRTLTLRGAFMVHPQSAIALASSTVANRKIFWVRAVDNTNKQLILQTTPTGLGGGSNWAIGGRVPAAGIVDFTNAIRGGDTVIQNTDIAVTSGNLQPRIEGGEIIGVHRWIGKTGARRLLTLNSGNTAFFNQWPAIKSYFSNLEIQNIGSTSQAIWSNGSGTVILDDVRFTDFANLVATNLLVTYFFDCEMTGGNNYGGTTNAPMGVYRCYIHDLAGTGATQGGVEIPQGCNVVVANCIIERCAANGVNIANAGPTNAIIVGNTIYRCSNSGIRSGVAQAAGTIVMLFDNIIKDNGNASTEANIDVATNGPSLVIDRRNLVNISGGLGGVNTLDYSLHSSDLTSDPLFVDPDNGTASLRNFGLQSTSPAINPTFTFPGSSATITRVSIGAVQNQVSAGGGLLGNANLRANMQ